MRVHVCVSSAMRDTQGRDVSGAVMNDLITRCYFNEEMRPDQNTGQGRYCITVTPHALSPRATSTRGLHQRRSQE